MKFGELLNAQLLSEWRAQYFQYEVAKKMLYNYKENLPDAQDDEERPSDFAIAFGHFEGLFFEFMKRELNKINTFFLEKLNEARRKFAALNAEVDEWLKYNERSKGVSHHQKPTFLRKILSPNSKGSHDFKVAYSEFYYNIALLQNYQQLNLTAFRKILKKHDKMLSTTEGQRWREKMVLSADFATTNATDELAAECERVVTEKLENGDHKRAIKMLRVAPVGQRPISPWAIFRVGVMCGYILLLAIFTSLSIGWFNCEIGTHSCWRSRAFLENATGDALAQDGDTFSLVTIRLYRGIFSIALLIVLFGINIQGWEIAGINHVLLFEIDLRDSVSSIAIIELGFVIVATCTMSLFIWLAQFYISYVANIPLVVVRSTALSYMALLFLFVVNPVPIFMYKTRFWLLKSLLRIFTAPFHSVGFADYFLAEQLLSLVIIFQDYAFIGCCSVFWFQPGDVQSICNKKLTLLHGVVASLPYWFRFAQCIKRFHDRGRRSWFLDPQIRNAIKYSLPILLVIFRSLVIHWNPTTSKTMMIKSIKEPVILVNNTWTVVEDNNNDEESIRQGGGTNLFHVFAILLAIVTIIYWYFWDTRVDWKLWQNKSVNNNRRFLRDQLAYRHTWYYYTCMCVDFLLLTSYWIVQVADVRLTGKQSYHTELLLTVVAFGEVFRRFVWNFLRMEHEHISNPGKMQHSTQSAILQHYSMKPLLHGEMDDVDRMMTLEDGVNEVRKEKRSQPIVLLT